MVLFHGRVAFHGGREHETHREDGHPHHFVEGDGRPEPWGFVGEDETFRRANLLVLEVPRDGEKLLSIEGKEDRSRGG